MNGKTFVVFKILGWIGAACAVLIVCGVITIAIILSRYEERAAAFDLTKIDELTERSSVYDKNNEFYSYFGGTNRFLVSLPDISPYFINALLAREDARFWEHEGLDPIGIFRAALVNASAGETRQGASTITQQLARNACELHGRTFDRKILEAVLARRIERLYTKEQILELYANRIYFGSGFYGIETAARGYFGKPAAELTLGEGAMLAGIIRSPNKLSPSRDLEAARAERDAVLDRMVETNKIAAAEALAAKAQLIKIAPDAGMQVASDYTMDAVLRELEKILAPEVLGKGGLKVYSTVDPELQRIAETAADRRLSEVEEAKGFSHPSKREFVPGQDEEGNERPTNYLQAAVVVIENGTGAIRAVVGGRDYTQSKYSRAVLAKRQAGSTFKPFVYAAAFEKGLLPGTLIDDSKIEPGEFRNISNKWSPENADGEYMGLQPAALGLLKSRNTMSVRIGQYAGLAKICELARKAGIGESVQNLPVMFLGGFETTVRDLTAAYTIFPNLGMQPEVHLISRVEDRDGQVLWQPSQTKKRVISAEAAWMVSNLLEHVMKAGTASKSAALGWKKRGAGKTGTTNDFFDAWFVGYTTSLTCGVWVGMDQPQTIMEKGYGSALALPIWVDIMQQAAGNKYPAEAFPLPSALASTTLCSASGKRATSGCSMQRTAYEATLPASCVPGETCKAHPELPPQQAVATAPPVAAPPLAQAPPAHPASPPPTQTAYPPVQTRVPPPGSAQPPPLAPQAVSQQTPIPNQDPRSAPPPAQAGPELIAPPTGAGGAPVAERPSPVPVTRGNGIVQRRPAAPSPETATRRQAGQFPDEYYPTSETPRVRRAVPVRPERRVIVREQPERVISRQPAQKVRVIRVIPFEEDEVDDD